MSTMDQQLEAYFKMISPKKGWHSTYSLGVCHQIELSGGVAWERDIFKNGVKVGSVENQGDGGCNRYYFRLPEDRDHFEGVANDAYLGRSARTVKEARDAMGIDWMLWGELVEAIPPVYTEHLGKQLLEAIT